jgi:alkanesulfonate monooxygenase SsuD/methylene tetrahydromethanopterin reductase-like flavin-dependent oxidoreductase (luciferase family)
LFVVKMDIGFFVVPFRLPGTDIKRGFDWDLQAVRWADEYGLSEAWFAEHYTLGWETSCAPELMIASAARETKNIRLAAGAHLLPYHNPIALAHRLMQLDHMTGGRLTVGVGAGAYPTDGELFGVTNQREIMAEYLDIMKKIWTADGEPFSYEGKYQKFSYPEYDEFLKGPHWKPLQQPHPPIAMAGLSPSSTTMFEAGKNGYLPLSFNVATDYLTGHWYKYVEGAESAGLTPDRNNWRVASNIFVADTDEEAFDAVLNGAMGRTYTDWMIPSYTMGGMLPIMAPGVKPEDATAEYFARNRWIVGSVDTVLEKIDRDQKISGGFGTLVAMHFDYQDNPEPYRRHLELLGKEVLPQIKDIKHKTEPLSELIASEETVQVRLGTQR